MPENVLIILIGCVFSAASVLATGFSTGVAPHSQKPQYPVTKRLRVVLLLLGLLF